MDEDTIKNELKRLSDSVQEDTAAIMHEFEKLLVAVSNFLRLADNHQKTLSNLGSSQEDLHRFIMNLILRLKESVAKSSSTISQTIEHLLLEV